jgi:hypothetical protein
MNTTGSLAAEIASFNASQLDSRTRFQWDMYTDILAQAASGEETSPESVELAEGQIAAILEGYRASKVALAEDSKIGTPHVAGTRGANQFGSYTVQELSKPQAGYIRRLLAERQVPADEGQLGGMQKHLKLFAAGKLGGKSASNLIDWLLTLPMKAGQPTERMATENQLTHVKREGQRRDHSDQNVAATVAKAEAGQPVTFTQASAALDVLFAAPFQPRGTKPGQADKPEPEDGMYRKDGVIYKVQRAVHGSGHKYAKQLVVEREAVRDEFGFITEAAKVRFEYASGAVHTLKPEHKMSLEEAKAFGALYGTCCQCGRTLTDEGSIADGIGPVCAKKFS